MSALTQMEQLAAFADFEERYNPHPDGHKHIATWAMEEIYRLQALLDAQASALAEMQGRLDACFEDAAIALASKEAETIERCAKVCVDYATGHPQKPLKIRLTAMHCAIAIREMGPKP